MKRTAQADHRTRTAIQHDLDALGHTPTEDEIAAIATARLLPGAIEQVRKLIHTREVADAHNTAADLYYVFTEPLDTSESGVEKRDDNYFWHAVGTDGQGITTWERLTPNIHKVMYFDLPDFCRAHGLDAAQMRKVGEGEIQGHREWTRTENYTGPNHLGSAYRKPFNPENLPGKDTVILPVKKTTRAPAPKAIKTFQKTA